MSIGVKGQWYLSAGLEGFDNDFISTDNFSSFEVVEEVGNILPAFRLTFYTTEPNVLNNMIHEGAKLRIELGKDRNSVSANVKRLYNLRPLKINVSYDGQGVGDRRALVSLHGVLDHLKYLNQRMKAFVDQDSMQVIGSIAEESGLTFFPVISGVDDSQLWIQHNTSNRNFVSHVWLHSHASNEENFQCIGITGLGALRFVNIPFLAKKKSILWNFSNAPDESKLNLDGNDVSSVKSSEVLVSLLSRKMPNSSDANRLSEIAYINTSNSLISDLELLQRNNGAAKNDEQISNLIFNLRQSQSEPQSYASSGVRDDVASNLLPYAVNNQAISGDDYRNIVDKANKLSVLSSTISASTSGNTQTVGEVFDKAEQEVQSNAVTFILYNDFAVSSKSGFFNAFSGVGRTQLEHSIEEQKFMDLKASTKPLMVEQFNRSVDLKSINRVFSRKTLTKNHHRNFWQSGVDHATKLALFSNMQISISLSDQFYPFEILDMANLIVRDLKSRDFTSISAHSGKYLIEKVVRAIHGQRLATVVWMRREGLNTLAPVGRLG